jgi:DNA-binding response OmpR family regulator
MRLLIVENDPVLRLTVATLARDIGFTAHVADGRSLVTNLLRNVAFDLVLMDMDQPWLDSAPAMHMLRNNCGPNKKTLVIGATSCTDSEELEAMWKSGLDSLVAKPYDLNELLEEMVRLLDSGPGRERPGSKKRLWTGAGLAVQDEAFFSPKDDLIIVLEEDLSDEGGA